jgi:hypothetical protein
MTTEEENPGRQVFIVAGDFSLGRDLDFFFLP